jgi:hypothetical protein
MTITILAPQHIACPSCGSRSGNDTGPVSMVVNATGAAYVCACGQRWTEVERLRAAARVDALVIADQAAENAELRAQLAVAIEGLTDLQMRYIDMRGLKTTIFELLKEREAARNRKEREAKKAGTVPAVVLERELPVDETVEAEPAVDEPSEPEPVDESDTEVVIEGDGEPGVVWW